MRFTHNIMEATYQSSAYLTADEKDILINLKIKIPDDEHKRLSILRETGLLDSPNHPDLDRLTSLTQRICRTPIAAINLIDLDKTRCISIVGPSARIANRDKSVSALAILPCSPDILVIEDTANDHLFQTYASERLASGMY